MIHGPNGDLFHLKWAHNVHYWVSSNSYHLLVNLLTSVHCLCSGFVISSGPMPDICILEICRSDLNRLNFEGFYTVLLEQNEELISVATIRWVYDCATTKYQAVGFAWNVIAFLVWFAVYVPSHFMVFWLAISFYRVFGQKVAEVPLVGTRIQYRRLGMCRILMGELEKVT